MPPETYSETWGRQLPWRLLVLFSLALLGYYLLMAALWVVGIETIYQHPTPFYALWFPVSGLWPAPLTVLAFAGMTATVLSRGGLRAHRPYLVALCGGLALLPPVLHSAAVGGGVMAEWLRVIGLHIPLFATATAGGLALRAWGPGLLDDAEAGMLQGARLRRFLVAVFLFAAALAFAVAFMRGGLGGISQAYGRSAYEYAGDIGVTRSVQDLFSRYLELRPYLSMHAKVHPPGPIAVLWMLSYVVGQSALGLSLATILVGAATVFPLYGWLRCVVGARAAAVGTLLYVVMPSIVLFTATSADILFMPFTVATLYFFERAIRVGDWRWALAAGVGFALMSLLKFSLLAMGFYFAFRAIAHWWVGQEGEPRARFLHGVVTAAAMVVASLGVHGLVVWWSGFDYIGALLAGKAQFDLDQHHLDVLSPRWPAWTFRFWNPLTWFYFAGIPVSLLYLWRLRYPGDHRTNMAVFTLMLLTLNLLYLARGEGERSALYLFPFLAAGAALGLEGMLKQGETLRTLAAVLSFMLIQCWLSEYLFYTYW